MALPPLPRSCRAAVLLAAAAVAIAAPRRASAAAVSEQQRTPSRCAQDGPLGENADCGADVVEELEVSEEGTAASGEAESSVADAEGGTPDDNEETHAALPPVLMGSYQVTTPEELKAEIIAAETALETRAVVDGAPQVYDSPSVSISVRKVSNEALARNVTGIEAPDGAGVQIPRGVQGKSGGPITITITSYHASEKIMKALPEDLRVRFEKERAAQAESASQTPTAATVTEDSLAEQQAQNLTEEPAPEPQKTNGTDAGSAGETAKEPLADRVDFFTTKTSVSWRGNVNVKYAGLSASVPAHDRTPGKGPAGATFGAEEIKFAEDKQDVYKEVENLAGLPPLERSRAFRLLARKWHPDKNPDDVERASEVFNYLQELKEDLFGEGGRSGFRVFKQEGPQTQT